MKKSIVLMCMLAVFCSAAEITLSSISSVPVGNYATNGDIEKSNVGWKPMSGSEGNVKVLEYEPGNHCLQFIGDPEKKIGVVRYFSFAEPLPKGAKMFVQARVKKTGTIADSKKLPGFSADMKFVNGGHSYVNFVGYLPVEDNDWATFNFVGEVMGESKNASFYIAFYNQTGEMLVDDIKVFFGKQKLNVKAKGKEMKRIVIRNSVDGVVASEDVSGNELNKEYEVPTYGGNCVEIMEGDGTVTRRLFPSNVDANSGIAEGAIPLTPINRVIIPLYNSLSFDVNLPAFAGKKVYLNYEGYIQHVNLGGYANAFTIAVNGNLLSDANWAGAFNNFKLKTGSSTQKVFNKGKIILPYCNAVYPISKENNMYPPNVENFNPFVHRIDVTSLVKEGKNTIEIVNCLEPYKNLTMAVVLENLRLKIE